MSYLGEYGYEPRLNRLAVAFLAKILTPESVIFETGSGNSTIWFAKRAKRVVSLEDRDGWHRQVLKLLKKEHLTNVKIYFDPNYSRKSFDEILGGKDTIQYDVVLLDGPNPTVARLPLVKFAPPLVKPGGYLIVDDATREAYVPEIKYLDSLGWGKTIIPDGTDRWGYAEGVVIYQRGER